MLRTGIGKGWIVVLLLSLLETGAAQGHLEPQAPDLSREQRAKGLQIAEMNVYASEGSESIEALLESLADLGGDPPATADNNFLRGPDLPELACFRDTFSVGYPGIESAYAANVSQVQADAGDTLNTLLPALKYFLGALLTMGDDHTGPEFMGAFEQYGSAWSGVENYDLSQSTRADAFVRACLSDAHSADQDQDGLIGVGELLRVIQFFNSEALQCALGTEDGYAPGPGEQTCPPHNSDYAPQDWVISVGELLRLIQFFNSGGYHACVDGEDGFCVGPMPG